MNKQFYKNPLITLALLFFALAMRGFSTDIQNNIGGGTWTLSGSPYRIVGNCTLRTGFTLTVEPGVQIRFQGNYQFIVQGRLTMGDTAGYQVLVTSDGGTYPGINFQNSNYQNSLQNVRILNAVKGLRLDNTGYLLLLRISIENPIQYGIESNQSSILSDYLTITNAGSSGVRATGGQFTSYNALITSSGDHGIHCSGGTTLTLGNCRILDNNDDGIRVVNSGVNSNLNFSNCEASGNGVYGIYTSGIQSAQLQYISVVANGGHGLFLQNVSSIAITRLTASGNGTGPNMGSGLFAFTVSGNINSSTFDFNRSWGIYAQSASFFTQYSNFYQNTSGNATGTTTGTNAVFLNPQWQSTINTNRFLLPTSGLIDQGSPVIAYDPDRTIADIGHHYYNQNHTPYFLTIQPPDSILNQNWGDTLTFHVTYGDSDATDTVRVNWYGNGLLIGQGNTLHIPSIRVNSEIEVVLDDRKPDGQNRFQWTVNVPVQERNLPEEFHPKFIYPNPTNGAFRLHLSTPYRGPVHLYNSQGRWLTTYFIDHLSGSGQHPFTMPTWLPSGRYFIYLSSNKPISFIFLK